VSDEETSTQSAVNTTNAWNATIIAEFRANEGKVGGPFEDSPVLLLHTTGARTRAERTNPIMYLNEADTIYVFASKAGADTNPDWFHNLVAEPHVTVEIGKEKFQATARRVVGEERDRIYAVQAQRYPGFAEYQAKTTRIIPVVELVRT
jgi:deazaflavin-dependent oxidoreductase (nitroreductase family)